MKTKPKQTVTPAAAPVLVAQPPAVAPRAKLDPMQVPMHGLSDEEEKEVRAALLARLTQQLTNMSTTQIRSVAWYADIENADNGCYAPAQEFITTLVMHQFIRPLTPDDVAYNLKSFREDFEDMVKGVRDFSVQYPKLVAAVA